MSARVKIMLVAFISLVSIATWSFAEEMQSQTVTVNAGKEVKSETKVVKTKTDKVKKEKKTKKTKKTKKDKKVNK